ncbi:MAG: proline dehydrogenase family protein [Gemmatimonadales bacterium]
MVTRKFLAEGFTASVDYLGWYMEDQGAIEAATAEYLRLCAALRELRAEVYLSLDLTHFGVRSSVERCCDHVRRIADALPGGALIQVGGEAAEDADRVLEATVSLADGGAPLMATLQANLRRAAGDAERLAEHRIPVRLVKGAYVESSTAAYDWGEETDVAYLALAKQLAAAHVPLALATHDPALLSRLLPAIPDASVEVLLGVRERETRGLAPGRPLRVYVPYGENWFHYFLHRLAEARGA